MPSHLSQAEQGEEFSVSCALISMLSQEQSNVINIDVIKVFTIRSIREFGEQSNYWIIDWVKKTYNNNMNMKAIMCCIHLCEVSHIDSKYSQTHLEIHYIPNSIV